LDIAHFFVDRRSPLESFLAKDFQQRACFPDFVRLLIYHPFPDPTLKFLASCKIRYWLMAENLFENHGADIRARDDAALFYVADGGNGQLLQRFLRVPEIASSFKATLERQESLLKSAAAGGVDTLKIALAFASEKANLQEALVNAARHSHGSRGKAVQLLLQDPRMTEGVHMRKAFCKACGVADMDTVRLFLEDPRFHPTGGDHYNLSHIIMADDTTAESTCDLIQLLIDDGRFDVSDLLVMVAGRGSVEGVRLLISKGRVDPTRKEYEALRWACFLGQVEVVRFLLNDPRTDITRDVVEIARSVFVWDDRETQSSTKQCDEILLMIIKHRSILHF